MKLNRKWILLVALVLSVAMATTGTLAYLTDEDADINTMTLGKVEIVQNEQERTDHGLDEFSQDKPLYPAVYEGTSIPWADKNDWVEPGNQAWKVVEDNANVVDKFVTVTNIGKSDAYVRTIIAYEGDETYGPEGKYIHIVTNGTNVDPQIDTELLGVMEIEGVKYTVYAYTYPEVLVPDQTTIPSLKQVYMDKTADNDVVEQYGETYDILVLSQAVQAKGFENFTAKEALNEAFPMGEDNENVAGWFEGWTKDDIGSPGDKNDTNNPPKVIDNVDELKAAIAAGGSYTLASNIAVTDQLDVTEATYINLNGYTLTASRLEAKADTTIVDGTFVHGESDYPALSVSEGTLKMENVDIICEEYCNILTSGSAQAAEYAGLEVWSGKAVLDNCTITVKCDVKRYSNSVFGVGIHDGEFTMNGGYITIESAGSTKVKYNYEGAIFAASDTEKIVNLNNVEINVGEDAEYLHAWGGTTTVNTTDADGSWDGLVDTNNNAGQYTINYVD